MGVSAYLTIFLLFSFIISGCSGGGGGAPGSSTSSGSSTQQSLGVIQKGPFIFGSTINIYELDDSLYPNGTVYMTKTVDNLGNFSYPANIRTRYVQIEGDGYYFDELSNNLSSSRIILSSIADLSSNSTPSINILTTLQTNRLIHLLRNGVPYAAANSQSRDEVLRFFSIAASSVQGLGSLTEMRINGDRDPDGILLAASAALLQMAHTRANGNESTPAELSYLLSIIGSDLSTDGLVNDASLIQGRDTASQALDLGMIRQNIQAYYASRGVTLLAPKFEEWIDGDGTGLLPKRMVEPTPFQFAPVQNAEPFAEYTSNQITASGFGGAQYLYASISSNAILIKNGSALTKRVATLVEGDTLAVKVTTGPPGIETRGSLTLGSMTRDFVVSTRSPRIGLAMGNESTLSQGGFGGPYQAYPFFPDRSFTAHFISFGRWMDLDVHPEYSHFFRGITICRDNGNMRPGAIVGTGNTLVNVFKNGQNYYGLDGNVYSAPSKVEKCPQVFLGTGGVPLQANQIYWIIIYLGDSDLGLGNFPPGGWYGVTYPAWGGYPLWSGDGQTWTRVNYAGQDNGVPFVFITD